MTDLVFMATVSFEVVLYYEHTGGLHDFRPRIRNSEMTFTYAKTKVFACQA